MKKGNREPSENLGSLDKKFLWHPFSQMSDWEAEEPLVIVGGEGVYLEDVQGKRYLDGVSSLWCNVHGHGQPLIVEAVSRQSQELAHSTFLGLTHPSGILLAEKLIGLAPEGLTRVFYSDSGATAVEVALKMAFQYWQQKSPQTQKKKNFIALTQAYHGDTLGAVSVGGIDLFHEVYRPLLFPVQRAEAPYCYRCPFEKTYPECEIFCAGEMEEVVRRHAGETAAFILEPIVQGAGGMINAPPGFLSRVRKICDEFEILLVADEVATGFGRTGKMFACEHEGVRPDLLCLAKGVTGGTLPLAATLATEKIYSAFLGPRESKTFFHGHTYTGNPIACAAALANLEIFERQKTLEKMPEKIELLSRELKPFRDLRHVGNVRQAGFMVGIELVLDRASKSPYPDEGRIGHQVTLEARRRGLITRPLGNVIVLLPPLSTSPRELKEMVGITYESIRAVTEGA